MCGMAADDVDGAVFGLVRLDSGLETEVDVEGATVADMDGERV